MHTHPCEYAPRCQNTVTCGGTWERNHDGWPEAICDAYHGSSGQTYPQPCGECFDAMCVVCGQNTRIEGHDLGCSQVGL